MLYGIPIKHASPYFTTWKINGETRLPGWGGGEGGRSWEQLVNSVQLPFISEPLLMFYQPGTYMDGTNYTFS